MAVQLAQGVLKSRESTSSPWENIMVEVSPNNDTNTLAAGFAADYNSTNTYNTGDLCTHEGGFYKCKTDGVSGTWNSTRWDFIDVDTIKSNIEGIIGDGQLDASFTATDLTGAANELKNALTQLGSDLDTAEGDISALESSLQSFEDRYNAYITSGSITDIKATGIYYLTATVTGKPDSQGGGIYILKYNGSNNGVGLYVPMYGTGNEVVYVCRMISGQFTAYKQQQIKSTTITATTSGTGAIEIPVDIRNKIPLAVRYADTHVGLVYMRDRSYFTCLDSSLQAIANTSVDLEIVYCE